MKNPNPYGTAQVFKWTKEYLITVLTSGREPALIDPVIINAFKQIDRADFVPEKLKEKAYSDQEIDIGFNEKLTSPVTIAQMLTLMKPEYGGKYLDIGTGTGYVAALLGYIAGETGKVISIERIQWLWEQSRRNLAMYKNKLQNVKILYRDGMEGLAQEAPYNGIHITFALDTIPDSLKQQLSKKNGILVCPLNDYNLRAISRNGDEFMEEIVPGFVFEPGKEGVG